jgi:hypothetical protein
MFPRKLFLLLLIAVLFMNCSDAVVRQRGVTKKTYHTKEVPNARSGKKYKIRY